MRKSLVALIFALVVMEAFTALLAVMRGEFIEVQTMIYETSLSMGVAKNERLRKENEELRRLARILSMEIDDWRTAAAPALTKFEDGTSVWGQGPLGLRMALNPCVGRYGEWLAECLHLNLSPREALPIKIVHARPLALF